MPDWLTEETLTRHRNLPGPHGAREIAMCDNSVSPRYPRHLGEVKDMADWRAFVDGYDCGVRYMDDHIGLLFQALAAQGVMDDLIVIITADHGENLGELGLYAEHATADEITTRVPLIVRWPGVTKAGHVDNGLHYNLDLAPTLADVLGRPTAPSWEGQSYAPALRGEPAGRDYLVVSQCAHVCQRSARFGPWLYMRTYHDGYHLSPDEMLFNLEEDAHERRDLAAVNEAERLHGAALLQT